MKRKIEETTELMKKMMTRVVFENQARSEEEEGAKSRAETTKTEAQMLKTSQRTKQMLTSMMLILTSSLHLHSQQKQHRMYHQTVSQSCQTEV